MTTATDPQGLTLDGLKLDALHFIVTGAGIAYLLKIAGHDVTVLEKYPRDVQASSAIILFDSLVNLYTPFFKRDGGLRMPLNMTRLFLDLPGAKNFLDNRGTKCSGLHFRQGEQVRVLLSDVGYELAVFV